MTKIIEYSIWKSQQEKLQNFYTNKKTLPKRNVSKKHFYGKEIAPHRYEPKFIEKIKFYFSNKIQKQRILRKRELGEKARFLKNLDFIRAETQRLRCVVSADSNLSELEKIQARNTELTRAFNQLKKDFHNFPELYTNDCKSFSSAKKESTPISQTAHLAIKQNLEGVDKCIHQINRTCSNYFMDQTLQELTKELQRLKDNQSPDEVQKNINNIEKKTQSKSFLLNKEDLDFLNEIIKVADYLSQLRSQDKICYNEVLGTIFDLRLKELRNDFLELENIEDYDVLRRSVILTDKKICQLEIQLNFAAILMDEDQETKITEEIQSLKNDLNESLHQVVLNLEIKFEKRIEAYHQQIDDSSLKLFKKERNRTNILKSINSFSEFTKFLGREFEELYKPSIEKLKLALDGKNYKNKSAPVVEFSDDELSASDQNLDEKIFRSEQTSLSVQQMIINIQKTFNDVLLEFEDPDGDPITSIAAFHDRLQNLKEEITEVLLIADPSDNLDGLATIKNEVDGYLNQFASASSRETFDANDADLDIEIGSTTQQQIEKLRNTYENILLEFDSSQETKEDLRIFCEKLQQLKKEILDLLIEADVSENLNDLESILNEIKAYLEELSVKPTNSPIEDVLGIGDIIIDNSHIEDLIATLPRFETASSDTKTQEGIDTEHVDEWEQLCQELGIDSSDEREEYPNPFDTVMPYGLSDLANEHPGLHFPKI